MTCYHIGSLFPAISITDVAVFFNVLYCSVDVVDDGGRALEGPA